ncbi:MAG: hypothetical protein COA78_21810 [Blastopirellula sp.]|nr:MAG: hypothetical protein COA78_21810 [Blastopirellula sp.]
MNSTAFNLLPDHDVVIKNRIKLPSENVSRQVAKAQRKEKKKLLTQRHRENRGLGFRLHLVDHVFLVKKKILTRSLEEVLLQTFLVPLRLGVIFFVCLRSIYDAQESTIGSTQNYKVTRYL